MSEMEHELQKLYIAAKRVTQAIVIEDAQTADGDYTWQRVSFKWHGTEYVYETINGNDGGFLHDMLMLKLFVQHVEARFPELAQPEMHEVHEVQP